MSYGCCGVELIFYNREKVPEFVPYPTFKLVTKESQDTSTNEVYKNYNSSKIKLVI